MPPKKKDESPPYPDQPGYAVYVQQPQPVVITNSEQPKLDSDVYKVGLFECCSDLGQFCFCYWCYCCYTMALAKKLNEHMCYPICCGTLPLNVRFRTIVGIRQSMCAEGCEYCWCAGCQALRLGSEIKERGFKIDRH